LNFSVRPLSIEVRAGWAYVNDASGDFSATGGANDRTDSVGRRIDDDGGRHRRQWPLARFDEVGRTGRHSKGVGHVGRREIVHTVVQDDARLLGRESGAKTGSPAPRENSISHKTTFFYIT
jgi:hypothetical protein